MNKLFCKLEPVDIIAMIAIVGGLILKLNGADGVVGSILMIIVAAYFGKKGIGTLQQTEDKKQNDELQAK